MINNSVRASYCSWGGTEAIDHLIPVSEGGRDGVGNVAPGCRSCNSSKRAVDLHHLSSRHSPAGSSRAFVRFTFPRCPLRAIAPPGGSGRRRWQGGRS
ncbi:HNH endonuclease [Streptomyces kanamyceticus]|uniref:HNH endonuclease n=1 Tax=Streptomyces kanamyceticus TaxID=1967 RepID=UPI0037DD84EA